MARIEASVVIKRPVEDVFAYVTDEQNIPKWESRVLEVKQTSEGPKGVGTTFQAVGQFLGRRIESTIEITHYEPNRKVIEKISAGPISLEETFIFEPAEGGTRLTIVGEGETGGSFKMAERIVVRMFEREVQADLVRLKDILEAGA